MRWYNLQSVVETINDKVGRRLLGNETGFVLLHDFLFGSRQSRDVVDIRNTLVRSVLYELSGNRGVKTGHLEVDTNVGVIDIDNLASAQKANVFVIANGVGRKNKGPGSKGGGGSRSQEIATVRGQGSGTALLHTARGDKGSDGTVIVEKNVKTRTKVSESQSFSNVTQYNIDFHKNNQPIKNVH
jgi:hypothetical protein